MSWQPTSEAEIWDEINASRERMTLPQRRVWEVIRIDPVKWSQKPYGDLGGGFWVVAIAGYCIIWYNDIERGFERSFYKEFGDIGEYSGYEDDLEGLVQQIMNEFDGGLSPGS